MFKSAKKSLSPPFMSSPSASSSSNSSTPHSTSSPDAIISTKKRAQSTAELDTERLNKMTKEQRASEFLEDYLPRNYRSKDNVYVIYNNKLVKQKFKHGIMKLEEFKVFWEDNHPKLLLRVRAKSNQSEY